MIKYCLIIFSLLFTPLLQAEEPIAIAKVESNTQTGEEIFNSYCADACHQAPNRNRLRPNQWRVVLKTMQTRMKSKGMMPLNEEQNKHLLSYLSQED